MAAGLTLDTAAARLKAVRARLGRSAGGAALGVFAIRVAAAGLAYVAQVLMARLMGGTEYGVFASVWVWIAVLGHGATLGLSQGACRFLPAQAATGRHAEARGFLIGGAALSMGGGFAMALLGLLALRIEGTLLAGPYGTPIVLAALVLPLFAFQDYLEGVARSRGWAVLAIAPPYLLRQGLIVLGVIAAVLLGAPPRATAALACTLAATGLAVAVQAAWLLARLGREALAGPRSHHWRAWLTACLPIAAGDVATAVFGFLDVLLLGALMPPAAVGVYFAATRIQQFVVFVHYAASAATAQRFSAVHAAGDAAALHAMVKEQALWTALATALVGLGIVVVGPWLLALFGPEFGRAAPVLAVLITGSVGTSLFGPGEDLLTMLGGERLCAGITLAALGLGGGLCFALVPWLGLIGAAASMAVAALARGLAMALGARAVHGIDTTVFSTIIRYREGAR